MGTRGFIIVKFRHVYYKIYNHWDSYPTGLGKKVIDFLQRLKDHNELVQTEACLHTIIQNFVRNEEVVEEDGHVDIMIEWVYKIDLDQLLLIVESWNKVETFNLTLDLDAVYHELCKMGP